jgi:hypothetical protein
MKYIVFSSLLATVSLEALFAQETQKETAPPAKADTAQSDAKAPEPLKAGEFTLKPEAGWQSKEARAMSAGGYQWLKDGKPIVEVDVYHFGKGQGGSVEGNIARWEGQFKEGADGVAPKAEKTTLKYGERKAILVDLKGTFVSGSMFGEKTLKEGHAMIGAILESEEGAVFVKCTGAEADMKAARASILKMLDSAYGVAGVPEKAEPKKDEPQSEAK